MAKKFGGFTEQQKEVLARKMGFNGPMHKFGEFLQSSPEYSRKFLQYESKAKQMVEGTNPQPAFSDGGYVMPDGYNANVWNTLTERQRAAIGVPAPTSSQTNTGSSGGSSSGSSGGSSTRQVTGAEDVNTIASAANQSQGMLTTRQFIENPQSAVTPVSVNQMSVSQDELISPTSGQAAATAAVQGAQTGPTAQASMSPQTAAPQVTTALSAPSVASATEGFQAARGQVSQQSQVEAATALPSADATVQGQLARLMQQFEGGEVPAWAAGAIRNANGIMAQRGLGASSIAGSAVTQAAMESAIAIAAQDANTFSQFEMANLNNRQQARLVNAQAFLQMDLANMDAEQQMTMLRSQSIIQSLFTDQAAENASRQFNATSQAQTDQFFANLRTQVSQFNAAQQNAMSQFNVEQSNAVDMFNRQMDEAREQFNAANRLVIDQSNAQWRRAVTTANNDAINEANRINAQNAMSLTTSAYNNLMQRERDLYTFAFTASENSRERANQVTLSKMAGDAARKSAAGQAVGSLAASMIDGVFSLWS